MIQYLNVRSPMEPIVITGIVVVHLKIYMTTTSIIILSFSFSICMLTFALKMLFYKKKKKKVYT